MKRISLLYLVLIANIAFISCTEESITDVTNTPEDHYAIDGENNSTEPEEEPPSGGD